MRAVMLVVALAAAGCTAAEDARPNPELKPPAVPPGRGAGGGAVPARG